MKRTVHYSDEPIGEVEIVEDFLPSPAELAMKEEKVKVTIGLSRSSVDFFKREADKNHTRYQTMIRHLLDHYVQQMTRRP